MPQFQSKPFCGYKTFFSFFVQWDKIEEACPMELLFKVEKNKTKERIFIGAFLIIYFFAGLYYG